MFNELVKRIEEQLDTKSPATVAITGFAGAGKSTLADRLAKYFKIEDEQVIRLDNLLPFDDTQPLIIAPV